MTGSVVSWRAPFGYETFDVAVALALLAGALALVLPSLTALVAPLAALALAGWAGGREGLDDGRRRRVLGAVGFLAALAAWVPYLAWSGPYEPVRGIALAAGLLPLGILGRRRPAPGARGARAG